ncbi:hypothetical protein LOK49_LG15G01429 [Camellia lanceoleosa]|uniref:Uncharacterized protein n=1 Tax=Camellia lanceoleosa TaxID=1840588 RepID=A0ACC0F8K7_9ERIC|nr:hypothetical protein LOK49_LG15G01429 [Camellia lanceoleosa]
MTSLHNPNNGLDQSRERLRMIDSMCLGFESKAKTRESERVVRCLLVSHLFQREREGALELPLPRGFTEWSDSEEELHAGTRERPFSISRVSIVRVSDESGLVIPLLLASN